MIQKYFLLTILCNICFPYGAGILIRSKFLFGEPDPKFHAAFDRWKLKFFPLIFRGALFIPFTYFLQVFFDLMREIRSRKIDDTKVSNGHGKEKSKIKRIKCSLLWIGLMETFIEFLLSFARTFFYFSICLVFVFLTWRLLPTLLFCLRVNSTKFNIYFTNFVPVVSF